MTGKISNTLIKTVMWLLAVILTGVILYVGKTLFIPMFMGLLIAMVMYPVCKNLEKRHIPKSIAISISISIVVLLFAGLIALLVWQINIFRADLPVIIDKLNALLPAARKYLTENWGIGIDVQDEWAANILSNVKSNTGSVVTASMGTTVNTLFILFITPIFSALFLYHRGVFVRFLNALVGQRNLASTNKILRETTNTYFNYIKGMIMVYLFVGILNSLGLFMLGIKHALLFGMLTAIMTIIPYVGIIVSALIPISIAFLTKGSVWYPIGVIAVFSFVQYLEANIIFPKIVGKQLNVSTWATLVAIIAGGIIWGVAGMILFIPFVAILKIITDNVEEGKALNILLNRE